MSTMRKYRIVPKRNIYINVFQFIYIFIYHSIQEEQSLYIGEVMVIKRHLIYLWRSSLDDALCNDLTV